MKNGKEKLMVYPYGREFAPVIRNRCLFEKFEVISLTAPPGWGMEGRDASIADKGMDMNIVVHSDFDKAMGECDTILVADCSLEGNFREGVYKNILKAIEYGKNIICTMNLDEVFLADALKKSSGQNVYFKYYGRRPEIYMKPFFVGDSGHLQDITAPVVFIGGISENTGKFEIQLSLRSFLLEKGYRVSQIGSRHYCELLGFHSMPGFMYETGFSEPQKILLFNQYVRNICVNENPDIILIGIPGDITLLDGRFPGNFGTTAFHISNAVKPDYFILSAFYTEAREQLEKIKKHIESKMGYVINCINISNVQFDLNNSNERKYKCYNYLPYSLVDKKLEIFKETGIPLVNILGRHGKEEMAEMLVNTLSSYCMSENICIGGM
jgi:peptide maturation system protein (TIGR04066 family)